MPSIGISLKRNYYTPEAYAYKDYLTKNGWDVQLDYEEFLSSKNDITIMFLGVDPVWKKNRFKKIIHDYPSLSTGKFPKTKNLVKKYINRKPDGRIFLNSFVENEFNFKKCENSININAGVDSLFFDKVEENKEYDLVYSGSILGRDGLISELQRLAILGLRILIIGEVDNNLRNYLKLQGDVHFSGRVKRCELPGLYRLAKAGLSISPDIYPFNSQTTIKTLEYLASGIGLVSNHYGWINQFSDKYNYQPLWTGSLKTKDDFDRFEFSEIDMLEFSWGNIFKNVNFNNFVDSLLS
jgi:hypothetical protein